MTVIFSRKCELGLQAVLYLTANNNREVVSSEEIANKLNIPKEFVSKILQSLTSSGIVESKKGKNGGFALAKDARKIKLIDIVRKWLDDNNIKYRYNLDTHILMMEHFPEWVPIFWINNKFFIAIGDSFITVHHIILPTPTVERIDAIDLNFFNKLKEHYDNSIRSN